MLQMTTRVTLRSHCVHHEGKVQSQQREPKQPDVCFPSFSQAGEPKQAPQCFLKLQIKIKYCLSRYEAIATWGQASLAIHLGLLSEQPFTCCLAGLDKP